MYFKQEIGKWGENLACKYLEANHYKIVDRNFLCHQGEIDIIAKDITKKELVFIEVKTRCNLQYGNPAEAVTEQKLRHIKQAIKYYRYRNHIHNVAIRVDVIEVILQKQYCKMNHITQVI